MNSLGHGPSNLVLDAPSISLDAPSISLDAPPLSLDALGLALDDLVLALVFLVRLCLALFHHPLPLEKDLSSNPMLFLQLGGWLWLDGVHHLLLLEKIYPQIYRLDLE